MRLRQDARRTQAQRRSHSRSLYRLGCRSQGGEGCPSTFRLLPAPSVLFRSRSMPALPHRPYEMASESFERGLAIARSQAAHLELFARAAKSGEPVLQEIGQLRHAEQIGGRAVVVRSRRFGAQSIPVFEVTI